MKRQFPLLFSLLVTINIVNLTANQADSADVSLFDRSIEELIEQEVTIATKSNQKLSQTPSVVSVITAEDIKAMGYRELEEVLQVLPGFEVSQPRFGTTAFGIRGVNSIKQGGRLLVLLDGTPYNDIMYGSSIFFGRVFNLDAVERIEIIRGPGSALYGKNAFSGVVNIITKEAVSDNNVKVGASYGSYNTFDVYGSYGIKKKDFNANITAKYFTTDATNSTYNNGEGGESIWNIGHENIYLNANAEYKNFQFHGSFSDRVDGSSTGTPLGDFVTQGSSNFQVGTYSLAYNKEINSKTNINVKAYGRNEYRIQGFELATPRTTDTFYVPPIDAWIPFNYAYPEGGYAEPVFNAYTYGAEIEIGRQLLKNNKLLVGFQSEAHGVKNATVRSNYDLATLGPLPNRENQYTKDNMPLYEPGWILNSGHDYINSAVYFQDVHSFKENFSITLGGRGDYNSEVGYIFNPRLAVVWEPIDKSSVKLMYGQAYRAPTTSEQYKIMGSDMGNKDLDHEKISTIELVLAYQFDKIFTQISFYYNELDNLILQQYINDSSNVKSYYNTGQNASYGFEFEAKYKLSRRVYGFANYSYNESEDAKYYNNITTNTSHANVSKHKFNIGLNTKVHEKISWSVLLRYQGELQKFLDENSTEPIYVSKDKVGDYYMLNSTLLLTNFITGLDLSIQAYNLFDVEYYYQDSDFSHQPSQPGRHFLLRVSYNFNL